MSSLGREEYWFSRVYHGIPVIVDDIHGKGSIYISTVLGGQENS